MTLRFRVTSETAGRQLQSICRRELHLSAAQLRKLKSEQGLLVNGSPAFASSVLAPGDEIIALLREDLPDYPPEPGELHILYEDALMLALDKPQGSSSIPPTAATPAPWPMRSGPIFSPRGRRAATR